MIKVYLSKILKDMRLKILTYIFCYSHIKVLYPPRVKSLFVSSLSQQMKNQENDIKKWL